MQILKIQAGAGISVRMEYMILKLSEAFCLRTWLRWAAKEANDPACAAVLCSHDKESKAETIEF